MQAYFDFVNPNLGIFYQFHAEKNFRGLNFNAYCRNRATLDHISKSLTRPQRTKKAKKTVVGFGDFSQQDGMRFGKPKAPILKLKRHLRHRCRVVDIDEYRTSKTCNSCHARVEQYKNYTTVKYKKVDPHSGKETLCSKRGRKRGVYAVIRCTNNECLLSCMNRDVNAAMNMLVLLKHLLDDTARPTALSRSQLP